MVDGPTVEFSVIIEWENVLLAEDDRCFEMLRKLRHQLASYPRKGEVIVLYNPEQVDGQGVESVLSENLSAESSGIALRVEAVLDEHYYDLKNEGARRSKGEIVVFFDSDVIPEDNWLASLVEPFFEDAELKVLAGHTYLAHDDFWGKAFALGWFFPLREDRGGEVQNVEGFFANNVAFRKSLFLNYGFPKIEDGSTRGACKQLAKNLISDGIEIKKTPLALAHHPAPCGLSHCVARSLAHGRDRVKSFRREGNGIAESIFRNIRWACTCVRSMTGKFRKQRESVGLSRTMAPVAYSAMLAYYAGAIFGGTVGGIFPGLSSRIWRI